MILSTRRNPPKHIPLPKTSQQHRNVRQFLLSSPLPSPSLPSILPRHGKKPPRLNTRRALRTICWLAIIAAGWVILQHVRSQPNLKSKSTQSLSSSERQQYGGAETLPRYASPVAIDDARGRTRWTVYIPKHPNRPLPGSEYAQICADIDEVSHFAANSKQGLKRSDQLRYKDKDPNYVEIDDAQQELLLPQTSLPHADELPLCKRSLTHVLDASDAGLGRSLLGLWLSYGLAKREGRAFFVDDSTFTYGRVTDLFSASFQSTDCRPPPWNQRTPCPHHAKHLVVAADTYRHVFGLAFQSHFSVKDVYTMARQGYEALFKLKPDDTEFVRSKVDDLRTAVKDNGLLLGMHIRRGDRRPVEFQYQQGYLPLSKYTSAAENAVTGRDGSVMVLASDDADLRNRQELSDVVLVQKEAKPVFPNPLQTKGMDWKGGFFASSFWSLGLPEEEIQRKLFMGPKASKGEHSVLVEHNYHGSHHTARVPVHDYKSAPTLEGLRLRQEIARSYLLDLTVLAESDEVVCAVSSSGCRMLGVMMGWQKLHQGKWRNVDGDYGWKIFI